MAKKMTVDELRAALRTPEYTARTAEDLQREAETRYASVYNQKRNTAQQNYETTDLAYQNQLSELANTLQDNQAALQKQTADSVAAANRYLTTRGMQRSSYGLQNQTNIERSGAQNLLNLQKQYATNVNGIQNNRTLLAQQLANTLASYDTDYANDVLAYIDQQKQLDYERQAAADQQYNALQTQLFEYSRKYGSGSGGGGGSRSSGGTQPDPANASNPYNRSLYDILDASAKQAGNQGHGIERESATTLKTKQTTNTSKLRYDPTTKSFS